MKFIVDDVFVAGIYIRSWYRKTNRQTKIPKNSQQSAPTNNAIILHKVNVNTKVIFLCILHWRIWRK